jgi:hypothetical protein
MNRLFSTLFSLGLVFGCASFGCDKKVEDKHDEVTQPDGTVVKHDREVKQGKDGDTTVKETHSTDRP